MGPSRGHHIRTAQNDRNRLASVTGLVAAFVTGHPANGGEPAYGAWAHDDALVLQESALQDGVAVAAKTAAGSDDAMAGHAGRPTGSHDGAHGAPGAGASRHRGHITIGGDPPSRNPAYDVEYTRFERTGARCRRSGPLDSGARHETSAGRLALGGRFPQFVDQTPLDELRGEDDLSGVGREMEHMVEDQFAIGDGGSGPIRRLVRSAGVEAG